jgi:hypothetical protein
MPHYRKRPIDRSSYFASDFGTYLLRAFVFAPLAGAFCGYVACLVGVSLSDYVDLELPIVAALGFGLPTGFLFGLLSFWSLRKAPLRDVAIYLIGGTLLFALPVALISDLFVLSLPSGAVGYWMGFLFLREHVRQRQKAKKSG